MKHYIAVAALIVVALFFVGWQSRPTQYEYQEVTSFKDVNKMAAEGWELVTVTRCTGYVSNLNCFYLKRAK